MNDKAGKTKNQVKVQNSSINVLSAKELTDRIESIKKELKSYTWRELEINGKFAKNDKISFISDEILIVGCDIGSETHYIRAIDTRGRELSKDAFSFGNNEAGFEMAKAWVLNLAAVNDKKRVVLGLEPTGHYWFAQQIIKLDKQLAEVESALHGKCMEIPHAENILEIRGVGENILSGILAEMLPTAA